ncbi:MAG TPA: hypothetical protein VFY13_08200, partial [Luteolibacter sp.]|nr:hypothetical protein [Luteolibacter sp.]
MLILLTVIAVGLLSLSSISIKSAGIGAAEARARSNARMALMMALDRLQIEMGPDQRVSANADILSANTSVANPHWMGVWDSWVAGAPNTAAVNPNYPSPLGSTHQTIGNVSDPLMRPTYAQKNRHFRGWLLSMNPEDATNIYAAVNPSFEGVRMPGESDDAVVLVGEGSLGLGSSDTDEVSAKLIEIEPNESSDKNRGRFAWWVGDESQKATIKEDSYAKESSLTMAQRLFRQEAPDSMGNTSVTGLDTMTDESQLPGLVSKKSIELLTGVGREQAQPRFHDITTSSYGVLADVREGGLKRDLNTILERTIDPNEVYELTYVNEFQRPFAYKTGGEAFMLYNFDSMYSGTSPIGMANVPIQDLAAYYQMYDHSRPGWRGGVQFSSSQSSPAN